MGRLILKFINKLIKIEMYHLDETFSIAYEHGLEKGGYKSIDGSIPCWDEEKEEEFKKSIDVKLNYRN